MLQVANHVVLILEVLHPILINLKHLGTLPKKGKTLTQAKSIKLSKSLS